ncbi:uncharacterized protein PADG_07021 [Paracoccidioides brasiliensis Pb18]|uniref:Uncharacterized protein n=1 Tax=Paracoccidioides brasiliensis (strain Pb18) TaxID=502780 RepID=C1GID5_PARBD|nr:uncharacterized protein PADG_07021 [Paracoccidioides brasiliensis Pb18]EEH42201.2 hypothetical protein PADG_07021 [Paracoccidioides brasiliensis Pb18]ODH51848.1 hypothetical protein GX48_02092 [Paracoccidioides brasiliensis]
MRISHAVLNPFAGLRKIFPPVLKDPDLAITRWDISHDAANQSLSLTTPTPPKTGTERPSPTSYHRKHIGFSSSSPTHPAKPTIQWSSPAPGKLQGSTPHLNGSSPHSPVSSRMTTQGWSP